MPDLDDLLRTDGAVWRSEVDARGAALADAVLNRHQPRRVRRWHAALVAATLTLLVAVGSSYLATRTHQSPTRQAALPALSTSGTTVDPLKRVPAAQVADASRRSRPVPATNAERGGWNYSMPWRFIALLDNGRTVLVSYALGDPCDRPLGFRVQQGRNAVELTALSNVHHDGCEQSLIVAFGAIHLDRPLGNRLLLHAPTDRH